MLCIFLISIDDFSGTSSGRSRVKEEPRENKVMQTPLGVMIYKGESPWDAPISGSEVIEINLIWISRQFYPIISYVSDIAINVGLLTLLYAVKEHSFQLFSQIDADPTLLSCFGRSVAHHKLAIIMTILHLSVSQTYLAVAPFPVRKILSTLRKIYLLKVNKQSNVRCWKWDAFKLKIFKLFIEIHCCKFLIIAKQKNK